MSYKSRRLSIGTGLNPFGSTLSANASPDIFAASPGSTLVTPLTSPRHMYFQSKTPFTSKHFSLIYAVYIGDLDLVKKYIEVDKIDPDVLDYDHRGALHVAAQEGRYEVVEYLLTKLSDINELDKFGASPLRCAMNANQTEVVELLKQNGAKTGIELSGEVSVGTTKLSKGAVESKLEKFRLLFEHLDGFFDNRVYIEGLNSFLETRGLYYDINPVLKRQVDLMADEDEIIWSAFAKYCIEKESVLQRALSDDLIIPNWQNFCLNINSLYWECVDVDEGVAPVGFESSDEFGITIVSADGQVIEVGDTDSRFPLFALISPLLYAIDVEDLGYDVIHEKVGKEPCPLKYDEIGLNIKNKPQNPLIHSGSLVCAEFIKPKENISGKFKYVAKRISQFVDGKVGFDNRFYLSQKEKKDKLSSLSYYIAANEGFSNSNTIGNISETTDFLLQLYSLEMSPLQMATACATFSNGGVCPFTGERAISKLTTQKTLQMMYSCGMYDVSGEWACGVGLPSKSGLNGLTMIVVPGLCGIVINSPKVNDKTGNSIRAELFAKKLTERYSWSAFDVLYATKKERLLQ